MPSAKRVRAVVPEVAKRFRKPTIQQQTEEALSLVPRITNETVAEHREKVLKGARKYKYPLQHSKRKIVLVSTSLLGLALVSFLIFTVLSLYRFQSTSLFMYRVTQVIPFPVAKTDKRWVSYESYLFGLRRYMHYYETHQQVDFTSESGKLQLESFKPRALQQVIDDSYVKVLASQHNVNVSSREVDDAVEVLRLQNQLGGNNTELASVTKKFFGWSLQDLRRQLKQELLAQKVAAQLDTASRARAEQVVTKVKSGTDFAALANEYSDDQSTKTNGGQYADTSITMSSQEVPPQIVRLLGRMQPGQVSEVVTTPTSFEVVKLLSVENGKYKAAHIELRFKEAEAYIRPLQQGHTVKQFIAVKPQK